MAVLRKKAKAKKAQLEASAAAAEARRAALESLGAVRDLAQALIAQIDELGLDEKMAETVERIRSTERYGRAEAAVTDLGRKIAESERVATGKQHAARRMAAALAGLGTWLATGRRGEALGIARSGGRSGSGWFFALAGVGIGYAIGILTAPKEGREIRDQLASRAGQGQSWNGPAGTIEGDPGVLAPSGDPQLADKVRTRLGEDPRTADLPSLNIDVVDGRVVVRGPRPEETDEDAIRAVVAGVDGVRDVEMKLGSA